MSRSRKKGEHHHGHKWWKRYLHKIERRLGRQEINEEMGDENP